MSTLVLPALPGLAWPVTRSEEWKTRKPQAISGKETAISDWSYPSHLWEASWDLLRQGSLWPTAFTEMATLAGFFDARQGGQDSFLYADPDDSSVTGQAIGNGDGATLAFQLVRAFGGFIEPILAPNNVSAAYLAGAAIPAAGLAAPAAPGLSQVASGTLAAATYYAKATLTTNSGETLPSAESSLAVSVNNVLKAARPASPPAAATGWNVYVSTSTGAETKQNGATPIALNADWQEPNTGLVAGSALPASNTTGWSVANWGAVAPGMLIFAGAPALGIAISADFTFYFPCRFVEDQCAFEKFMGGRYAVKKLSWRSIK